MWHLKSGSRGSESLQVKAIGEDGEGAVVPRGRMSRREYSGESTSGKVTSMSVNLQIRQMSPNDVSDAMRLKEAAHWNQVPADWKAFIRLEPQGCFVGELDQEVVTTATNFNYENRFGWIGMILVDPAQRRKGIATRMMERSIAYLASGN